MQVLVDCSNSNTALVALGYLNQIGAQFAAIYRRDQMQRTAPQLVSFVPQVDLETRPVVQRRIREPVVSSFPASSAI